MKIPITCVHICSLAPRRNELSIAGMLYQRHLLRQMSRVTLQELEQSPDVVKKWVDSQSASQKASTPSQDTGTAHVR